MLNIYKKATSSLKAKLLLFVSSATTFILILTIGFLSIKTSRIALSDAELYINQTAISYAKEISSELNKNFSLIENLSFAYSQMPDYKQTTRDSITRNMLKNIINEHNHILSLWLHWELNVVDSKYQYGRVRNNFYRQNNTVNFKIDTLERNGDNTKGLYYQIKISGKNHITEPYLYSYTGNQDNLIYETSICSPITYKGKYAGLVGIDLSLNTFDEMMRKIKPFENSYAFFVSNQGTIVSHKDKKMVGKNITEMFDNIENFSNLNKIQYAFYSSNTNETKSYICLAPVHIGDTETPWSFGIAVPQKIIMSKGNKIIFASVFIFILGLLLSLLFIYIFAIRLSKPLNSVSRVIGKLALGEIQSENRITIYNTDEIGQISESLNLLTDGMMRMSKFAKEIGEGNLIVEYQMLGPNDVMGLSLTEMQKSLKRSKDEEQQRRKDEEIQNWINEGLSQTNELLRRQDLDFKQHSFQVLKLIVDYIKANQGVLFIAREIENPENEDENIEFLAVAALAWGRKRSITKAYKIGESLVGRCAFERTTIYLTQVPENYVNITSGLGKANPKYILLVPLEINENIIGVIEIASFNPIMKHEIEFIEKSGYGLASTIGTKQASEKTSKLLEQTKSQAEELTQKEEEMRQNMEELLATQEEFAKRGAEMDSLKDATSILTCMFHLDMSGEILFANENFCNFIGISKEQITGKRFNSLGIEISESEEMSNSDLWSNLSNGEIIKLSRTYNFAGYSKKLLEVYSPVNNAEGELIKVICVATELMF